VTTVERKPWHAIFRLLERDERVFAVLLAAAMVGGLATLGLIPLRPRQQIDLVALVVWFSLYKLGVFALVTIHPRRTRAIFLGALAVDLLLVFVLIFLTGGGASLFYLLFFPLVTVNAYYFGPWVALAASLTAGGLMAAAASLAPPWIGWLGVTLLIVLFGMPAIIVGIVAQRERRSRAEVERLNAEVTGTLNQLQAAQQELLVAERMATVASCRSRWPTRSATPSRPSSSTPRSCRTSCAGTRAPTWRRRPGWWRPSAIRSPPWTR
jgi:hypothetical protein